MAEFFGSTLWRVSAFERMRDADAAAATLGGGAPTLLPTTLLADLRQIEQNAADNDVLEVMAACVRHREPALLCLAYGTLVWPVTLFPSQLLYHSPRDADEMARASPFAQLALISADRPGVRPPGHAMHERVGAIEKYRPLSQLFWAVALHGPRSTLLVEIRGRAAYRLAPGRAGNIPAPPGALAPAVQRLRQDAAPLRDIARWPGMSIDRACRLLNALYLTESLMVTRSHPLARDEPAELRQLFRSGK